MGRRSRHIVLNSYHIHLDEVTQMYQCDLVLTIVTQCNIDDQTALSPYLLYVAMYLSAVILK